MKNSADLLIEEWNLPPSSIWRHRARQHQSHKTLDRWDSRDSILSRKISIQTWNQEHKLSVDWLKYMPQIHQCWICVHQLSMDFQYTLEPNLAFSGSGLYLFKKEKKSKTSEKIITRRIFEQLVCFLSIIGLIVIQRVGVIHVYFKCLFLT